MLLRRGLSRSESRFFAYFFCFSILFISFVDRFVAYKLHKLKFEDMEVSLIEKARYDTLKWLTVGWGVWFGLFILKDLILNKIIIMFFVFAGLIGWVLFTVNLIRLLRLMKKINADSKVKEALRNEVYQLYTLKSIAIGFGVVMLTTGCFIGVSSFYEIPAFIVCNTILYLGILATFIAGLIYNRG